MTLLVKQGGISHIGRRINQQDAYGFSDFEDALFIEHGGVLAVVCDGIGGMEKGDEASCLAVKTILDSYMSKLPKEPIPAALISAAEKANNKITQLGVVSECEGNIGTTLAAIVFYKEELFWCTSGDSRVYLNHGDKLIQLSTDHIYAQELILNQKANKMTLEDVANHPDSNALTSFLGIGENITFHTNKYQDKLLPNDSILVCSDGVFNSLSTTEIIEALRLSNPMTAAKELQNRVLDKQFLNQDNLTAIVFQVQKKTHHFFSLYAGRSFTFSLVTVLAAYYLLY